MEGTSREARRGRGRRKMMKQKHEGEGRIGNGHLFKRRVGFSFRNRQSRSSAGSEGASSSERSTHPASSDASFFSVFLQKYKTY